MENVYTLFSTGLSGLDNVLHGVQPGDNIVWQVDSVADYLPFVHPFCKNADIEKRKLIYFRFADHEQLVPDTVKSEVFRLHPEHGFEVFIDEIFDKIETFGKGAVYIFDSLSDLAVDWYSDRMLGNFFMLVCPYLYDYETAAYFGLIRHLHTSVAVNAIHNTAQVVIDVYRRQNRLFIRPLKVFKRHSDTMYMLHLWNEENDFLPVTNSDVVSEVLSSVSLHRFGFSGQRFDFWTRTFLKAKERLSASASHKTLRPDDDDNLFNRLLRMAITRDSRIIKLAERYLTLTDLVETGNRMIGTGLIGGKAAGMLIAHAVLRKEAPELSRRLSILDSFYIGSDLYYTYLIRNNCWWIRRRCRSEESFFDAAHEARQRLLTGTFTDDIMDQFGEMLDYFGQWPIIVRSSSLLEDAYGNSFSGKYESVFCTNQGTPSQRLESFVNAVRTVYASTFGHEALSYRSRRGLLDKDEQMSLLVQRVSGAYYGKLFFPQVAGVGFSYNPYIWQSEIDPRAGMLRIVFGLGTRAVDRSGEDHTRIVSLSAPLLRPEGSQEEKRKYSQRFADVLDLKENRQAALEFHEIAETYESEIPIEMFASDDEEIGRRAREYGLKKVFSKVLTFDKLLSETTFADDMRTILSKLETAYEHPVDVEFTANRQPDGSFRIALVQCRPFQVRRDINCHPVSSLAPGREVIRTTGPLIGNSVSFPVDFLIYVVPQVYSGLSVSDKHTVAGIIGKLMHCIKKDTLHSETIMLIGPGRWGTSSPSLGVPVSFADINQASVLCEIAVMHEGLIPDVSLGTHFFNDIVESDMLYMAIFPNRPGNVLDASFIETSVNLIGKLLPEASSWSRTIKVIGQGTDRLFLSADTFKQTAVCTICKE